MATAVALASILTSGLVALAVPFITSRQARITRLLDLELERSRDLRELLEDAGSRLARAERHIDLAQRNVDRAVAVASETAAGDVLGGGTFSTATASEAVLAVQEALHRITVNLGWDSTVASAYSEALRQLDSRLRMIDELSESGPDLRDDQGWQEVGEALGELDAAYVRAREAYGVEASRLIRPLLETATGAKGLVVREPPPQLPR